MSIRAAYMVPHPPLIIPAVGKGEEAIVADTIRAYEHIASDIAAKSPDTIVIISPHSVMYGDYFHISPGTAVRGDFGRFGAPQVRFNEQYDNEFVSELEDTAAQDGFPAGSLGEKDSMLDHGTMVPLYFIRKAYTGGRIVRIGLSGLPLIDHYKLGMYIKQVADRLGRNTVVVASGDLSHKLQEHGPYGFDPAGPVYDERIMAAVASADFGAMLQFDEDFLDKAAECGHRSFVIMAGTLDGLAVRSEVLSHQDVTGVGYGIAILEPGDKDPERSYLKVMAEKVKDNAAEASPYVRLARTTIDMYVRTGRRPVFPKDIPVDFIEKLPPEATRERAGTFVSVHKNGMLRGCIGTIGPVRDSIVEEIISNAVSAVSRDPRFDRVRADELPFLEISVDVLGAPEYIDGPEMLDVKRYGVIVSCGDRRGLLLPDLEGIDDVADQIDIAMRKGGIVPDDDYRLQRFEVIRYK